MNKKARTLVPSEPYRYNPNILFPENLGCFVHLSRHIHTEGATGHAAATVSAFGCMVGQGIVLCLQFRGETIVLSFVEHLIDTGNRDALGTGGAMVAIGALATFISLCGL